VQATSYLIGLLLIAAIWWCARTIGGDAAAIGAALLVLASPGVLHAGAEIMSDAPSALFVVGGLALLATGRERAAGVAMGIACVMRLDAVVYVPGLGRRRALVAAAWIVGALVGFQLLVHGNVWGYRGDEATFGLGYLTHGTVLEVAGNASRDPNWRFYPQLLLGAGRLLVVGAPLLAGWAMWHRRREAVTRTAMWIVASTFAVYLFYFFQSSRFMLPVFAIVTVFGGVALADALQRVIGTGLTRSPGVSPRP
jgi:4-amino-4-deoxy-L-arabinose transferase-like glycosyltransferase